MPDAAPSSAPNKHMPRSARRTASVNVAFHYAAICLIFINGIVLVPIYLHFVPPSLYGAWLATGNILAWIAAMDPGVSSIMIQRVAMAYGEGDRHGVVCYATIGVAFTAVLATIVCGAGFLAAHFIGDIVNLIDAGQTRQLEVAFRVAVVGTALMILAYAPAAINQGLQSSTAIGLIFVGANLVGIAGTLFLLFRGYGVMAIAAAIVIRGAGMLVGNIGYLAWRWATEFRGVRLSFEKGREFAGLSTSQYAAALAGVMSTQIDAVLVARVLGPDATTAFMLTRRAPDTCAMLVERPTAAIMPVIARVAGGRGADGMAGPIARMLRLMMWGAGLLAWGLIVFNESFVSLWVGRDKFAGGAVAVWMGLAAAGTVCARSLANMCYSLGEIRAVNRVRIVEAVAYVTTALVLLTSFGGAGLAAAPLVVVLGVSGWYFGGLLASRMQVARVEVLSVVTETGKMLGVAAASWWLWKDVEVMSWGQFGGMVMVASITYAAGAIAVSSGLRGELVALSRIIWSWRHGHL